MSEGTGRKKVVFISLPMSGFSDEHVRANIEAAKTAYLAIEKLDITQVVFVDNMDTERLGSPNDLNYECVWHLGHALQKLAACDEAFFWFGWRDARGCQVEHDVCLDYNIPLISVDRLADKEDVNEK